MTIRVATHTDEITYSFVKGLGWVASYTHEEEDVDVGFDQILRSWAESNPIRYITITGVVTV